MSKPGRAKRAADKEVRFDPDAQHSRSGGRALRAGAGEAGSQRSTRKRRSRKREWPMWQLIGIALGTFGGLGGLLTVTPSYSPIALAIAIVLGVSGATALLLGAGRSSWWHQVVVANSLFLLLLGFVIRAWNEVIPALGVWLVLLLGLYVLAWTLPAIEPKLSALLFREQLDPKTRLGRGCLVVALAIGPAAGGLGATFGLYGSRYGQEKLGYLAIGCLGTVGVLAWSQIAAHEVWPKRPWANKRASAEPEQQ